MIIKCQECNLPMRHQKSEIEYVLICTPCNRAVVVSDWQGNSELLEE